MNKNNFKTFFKKVFLPSAAILVFIFLIGLSHSVYSSATYSVSGYAWEADTNSGIAGGTPAGMGWLSFNCMNDNSCGASNYSVNIDASGNMTGYAWSSNYGWLQFGNLSGFPGSGGNAQLVGSNVTGWARFCSVFQSGCSGDYYHGTGAIDNNLSTNPYLGGWDGWVSLSGVASNSAPYGVTYNSSSKLFSGYAWGGRDVTGWIYFSGLSLVAQNASLSLLANGLSPLVWNSPASVDLDWSSSTGLASPANCVANGDTDGGWSGPKSGTSYLLNSYLSNNTSSDIVKTFGITCDKSVGGTISSQVQVTIKPAAIGHSACSGTQCIFVSGAGTNTCVNDFDCGGVSNPKQPHYIEH